MCASGLTSCTAAELNAMPPPRHSLPLPPRHCCHLCVLQEKTAEPWLLHDFGGRDFVGQEIRLLVCAYIRPEVGGVPDLLCCWLVGHLGSWGEQWALFVILSAA